MKTATESFSAGRRNTESTVLSRVLFSLRAHVLPLLPSEYAHTPAFTPATPAPVPAPQCLVHSALTWESCGDARPPVLDWAAASVMPQVGMGSTAPYLGIVSNAALDEIIKESSADTLKARELQLQGIRDNYKRRKAAMSEERLAAFRERNRLAQQRLCASDPDKCHKTEAESTVSRARDILGNTAVFKMMISGNEKLRCRNMPRQQGELALLNPKPKRIVPAKNKKRNVSHQVLTFQIAFPHALWQIHSYADEMGLFKSSPGYSMMRR
ncbi:uncharacterized protein CDV56_106421 [Aspergillus thermomutatus]|uniref:Uncharacterized protein n=1 Tax=Aspergillus thermomutatus TaxID=41047 RepID=A0A397HFK3_ASPTH|nr:uncharacterized protein CDV56_106421 [Aspergillus thermomutatus]RHZ61931.1 hypothetical protein CDV56_106421 [Aspergillus thermomutatus]